MKATNPSFVWAQDANGFWKGPDGCDYEQQWEARSMGVLGMCGCGFPKEAYNFLRRLIELCDRRGYLSDPPTKIWVDAEKEITKVVKENPEITAHVLMHFLNDKEVLEHGGTVGGSWLTKLGEDIVDGDPAPSKEEVENEESSS